MASRLLKSGCLTYSRSILLKDFDAGRVRKTVYSRSGKNMSIARPKRIFNRERVIELRQRGAGIRAIAKRVGVGMGTITPIQKQKS